MAKGQSTWHCLHHVTATPSWARFFSESQLKNRKSPMSYRHKNISFVLEVKLTPRSTTDVTHCKSSLKCTFTLESWHHRHYMWQCILSLLRLICPYIYLHTRTGVSNLGLFFQTDLIPYSLWLPWFLSPIKMDISDRVWPAEYVKSH